MVGLWSVVVVICLSQLGFDVRPILAGAGIVGLAVGFGAQYLVRDVIAGFFLVLEDQVRVGDVAVVNGTGGLVETVTFRTIVLRDLAGTGGHPPPTVALTMLANMRRRRLVWRPCWPRGDGKRRRQSRSGRRAHGPGAVASRKLRQDPAHGLLDPRAHRHSSGWTLSRRWPVVIKARLKTSRPSSSCTVGRRHFLCLLPAFSGWRGIEGRAALELVQAGDAGKPLPAPAPDRRGSGNRAGVRRNPTSVHRHPDARG